MTDPTSGNGRRPAAPPVRRAWRRVDGVLLLDKPSGVTSNTALQRVRRKLLAERGGHTGTLDPLASGLLPLAFGEATKFSQGLLDADKAYLATVKLGERTDTGDAEGAVIERRPVHATGADLDAVVARFRGPIRQVPPMYSALKRDGVPLYALARKGETVEREARDVVIHALTVEAVRLPLFDLAVRCSKGTYVRQLAEDIGEALGCGAHLAALRRTAVGPFDLRLAHPLDAVEAADAETLAAWLLPVDSLLEGIARVVLAEVDAARFLHGQAVSCLPSGAAGTWRAYGPSGALLGVGEPDPQGRLQPRRLVAAAPSGGA